MLISVLDLAHFNEECVTSACLIYDVKPKKYNVPVLSPPESEDLLAGTLQPHGRDEGVLTATTIDFVTRLHGVARLLSSCRPELMDER